MEVSDMSNATTSMTVRLDKNIKKAAQSIYSELGIDMTTAINVFLRQSIRSKGFPFDVTIDQPNSITLKAMEDTQNNVDMHGPFNTVKELMESLNADD